MNSLSGTALCSRSRVLKKSNRSKIEYFAFTIVLAVFLAIAVTQAFELGGMLAEANSIEKEIGTISAKREVLLGTITSHENSPFL